MIVRRRCPGLKPATEATGALMLTKYLSREEVREWKREKGAKEESRRSHKGGEGGREPEGPEEWSEYFVSISAR